MFGMATAFLILLQVYIIPASRKKRQSMNDNETMASPIPPQPVTDPLDKPQGDTTVKIPLGDALQQKQQQTNNDNQNNNFLKFDDIAIMSSDSDTESCKELSSEGEQGQRSRVNTMTSNVYVSARMRHNTMLSSVSNAVKNPDTGQHHNEEQEGSSFYLRIGVLRKFCHLFLKFLDEIFLP